MPWRLLRFPILASTNDLALEWIRSGAAGAGTVFVTEEQTAGRGRRGREWVSPKGALLCTVVMPFDPAHGGWTALAAGLATARAVRDLGVPAGVKWPNDVVLGGGKLGGILVEAPVPDLAAVGIGLNVSNPLPAEALVRPARLADTLPDVPADRVLEALLPRMDWAWELLRRPGALKLEWEALDTTSGRRVRWVEAEVEGEALGVDDRGALLIRRDDGSRCRAAAGDVRFL